MTLQKRFWNEMVSWRRDLVMSHRCDVDGCDKQHEDGNVYVHANGDGIMHLTTLSTHFCSW